VLCVFSVLDVLSLRSLDPRHSTIVVVSRELQVEGRAHLDKVGKLFQLFRSARASAIQVAEALGEPDLIVLLSPTLLPSGIDQLNDLAEAQGLFRVVG
jgi:hypothetical protein